MERKEGRGKGTKRMGNMKLGRGKVLQRCDETNELTTDVMANNSTFSEFRFATNMMR